MTFGARWTPHEILTIETLRAQGVGFPTIAAQIGRDPKSCADRLSAYRRTQGLILSKARPWTAEADQKLLELCATRPDRKRWKEIAPIMGRSISACYSRYGHLSKAKDKAARESKGQTAPAVQVDPDAVLKGRALYAARLRQSPCAQLMGDPPPGFSALDERRQACTGTTRESSR